MDKWLEAFVAVKLLQSSEICFQCYVHNVFSSGPVDRPKGGGSREGS